MAPPADVIVLPGVPPPREVQSHFNQSSSKKQERRRATSSKKAAASSSTPPFSLSTGVSTSVPLILRSVPDTKIIYGSTYHEPLLLSTPILTASLTNKNDTGAHGVPKSSATENDLLPPVILQTPQDKKDKDVAPEGGVVRQRVAKIEESIGGLLRQPPAMYVTVTTPLEVWAIPGPYIHTFPTLFYKVPEVHPCDFIFKLPASVPDTEVALVSLKAEPKLVRLLENSGIKLQRNRRLPPPPAICEEWWEQAEEFIKRKCKDQPKYGLGYIPSEFSESEDEEDGDQCVTCHVIHTDNDQYLSDEEVGNIIYQTSHKPRSFAAAANARHGVKNENYLLS